MLLVVFIWSVRWFGLPGEFGEQLADVRLRGPLGEAEWWGSSFASEVASCSLGPDLVVFFGRRWVSVQWLGGELHFEEILLHIFVGVALY